MGDNTFSLSVMNCVLVPHARQALGECGPVVDFYILFGGQCLFKKVLNLTKVIDGPNPSPSADCKLAVNAAHNPALGVSALGKG